MVSLPNVLDVYEAASLLALRWLHCPVTLFAHHVSYTWKNLAYLSKYGPPTQYHTLAVYLPPAFSTIPSP